MDYDIQIAGDGWVVVWEDEKVTTTCPCCTLFMRSRDAAEKLAKFMSEHGRDRVVESFAEMRRLRN